MVCCVSKPLKDCFLLSVTTVWFSFVSKYAHSLLCWRGLSPLRDSRPRQCHDFLFCGNIHLVALNILYRAKTTMVKLLWYWQVVIIARELFLPITSDENARRFVGLVEVAAVDGHQGAAHDAALRWRDSGHLWERETKQKPEINATKNHLMRLFSKEDIFLTYLRRSGTWRVCPQMKPCTPSSLVNS